MLIPHLKQVVAARQEQPQVLEAVVVQPAAERVVLQVQEAPQVLVVEPQRGQAAVQVVEVVQQRVLAAEVAPVTVALAAPGK